MAGFLHKNTLKDTKDIFISHHQREQNYCDINTNEQSYLLFGNESSGISTEIRESTKHNQFRIPMKADCRSLNLANTVAIVAYDQLRKNTLQKSKIIKAKQ